MSVWRVQERGNEMRKALTILTATTVVVVAAGIAMASIPDANGVIHGCYDTKHGDRFALSIWRLVRRAV